MLESLPDDLRALLDKFHFDRIPFASLRERVASAKDLDALHRIVDPIAPAPDSAIVPAHPRGSDEQRALEAQGRAAIERGELAVVILAGGMATRFGGVVKALATLGEDTSVRFLDVKLADIERHPGIDVTFMTSFATHDALSKALQREGVQHHLAPQFASLRLNRDGTLFRDDVGRPSPYATGHGDLPDALQCSGAVARWRKKGVQTVLVMNVDNLGASVDPALLALHKTLGGAVTAELVPKRPGDKGGVAALHQGQVKLCEAFRLPKDFPHDAIPTFNTNTLWIEVEALEKSEDRWTWCVAKKNVEGREAIQLERLIGEMTWWHPSRYIVVPRDGEESRFLPVKDVVDLEHSRAEFEAVLHRRMGLEL
jgi:UTP--glucose-1-phosphate uridylyltransferase